MCSLYLSYGEILEVPTSLKDCLWPEKVSLSCLMSFVLVQGHCFKKMQNFWAISCNGKWVEVKSWHKYHPWPENMSLPWVLVICACSISLEEKRFIHYPVISNWEIIELYFLSWGRRVRERVKLVSLLTVSLVDLAVCGELDIHVWKFDWKKKILESAQLFTFSSSYLFMMEIAWQFHNIQYIYLHKTNNVYYEKIYSMLKNW